MSKTNVCTLPLVFRWLLIFFKLLQPCLG